MGIHGLTKLIADCASSAVKDHDFKSYFGKMANVNSKMFEKVDNERPRWQVEKWPSMHP